MEFIDIARGNDIKTLNKLIKEVILPTKLNPNDKIIALKENKNIVSIVYFSEIKKCIYVNYIHTLSKFRKNGFAEKILRHLIKTKSYIKQYDVMILPDSGSDKLFSKFGFVFVGNNHMRLTV